MNFLNNKIINNYMSPELRKMYKINYIINFFIRINTFRDIGINYLGIGLIKLVNLVYLEKDYVFSRKNILNKNWFK